MKLSARTIAILKNFAKINSGIVFKPGKNIGVITASGDFLATAKIEDEFPRQFAIADLNQFINILGSFDDPDLKFKDKVLIISQDQRSAQYTYSEESLINKLPPGEMVFPKKYVTFKLSENDLVALTRISNVMVMPEIAIIAEKNKNGIELSIQSLDCKNPTGNVYRHDIGEAPIPFRAVFASDKINGLMPMDYDVTVSEGVIQFKGSDVTYYIAPIEKYSSYGTKKD